MPAEYMPESHEYYMAKQYQEYGARCHKAGPDHAQTAAVFYEAARDMYQKYLTDPTPEIHFRLVPC